MAFPWLAAAGVAVGALGFLGGRQANIASAREAQLNRDFQEAMSRTAHQREVRDLEKAGLNPILSGTGGRGASTPGGSMAVQRDPITPALSSALATSRLKQEIKNMKATEALTKHQSDVARSVQAVNRVEFDVRSEEYGLRAAHAETARKQLGMISMDRDVRERAFKGDMDEAKFWSSSAYGIKRRADAALETGRKLIPFTSPGGRPIRGGGGYGRKTFKRR